jgi:hypothetical protein
MIHKTIDALKKNKLHEAVLRISQFNILELRKLLVSMLIDDYIKLFNNKKKDQVVEYTYQFPDAYNLTFRLYQNKSKWRMSMFFNYEELLNLEITEDDVFLSEDFAEITLEKNGVEWEVHSMSNKKTIFNIIKNV